MISTTRQTCMEVLRGRYLTWIFYCNLLLAFQTIETLSLTFFQYENSFIVQFVREPCFLQRTSCSIIKRISMLTTDTSLNVTFSEISIRLDYVWSCIYSMQPRLSKSSWTLFLIQINDNFRNPILMKVFQFYVHCFLWLLLKHQYPECPPLFCITFWAVAAWNELAPLGLLAVCFARLAVTLILVLPSS